MVLIDFPHDPWIYTGLNQGVCRLLPFVKDLKLCYFSSHLTRHIWFCSIICVWMHILFPKIARESVFCHFETWVAQITFFFLWMVSDRKIFSDIIIWPTSLICTLHYQHIFKYRMKISSTLTCFLLIFSFTVLYLLTTQYLFCHP